MAKLALLQFGTDPDRGERRALVEGTGASVVEDEPRWPVFFDTISRERPDAIVIACAVLPSHAREAARYLGDGFNTRNIPVILVDVAARDLDETRASAPHAKIVERDRLAGALTAIVA